MKAVTDESGRDLAEGARAWKIVLVAAIPLLVWLDIGVIELLYVMVFAVGTLTVLYHLAEFALVPTIVTPQEVVDANAKLSAAQSANEVAGKAIDGVRVAARNRYVLPLFGEATTFNVFNEIFVLGLLVYAVREVGLSPAIHDASQVRPS